MKRILLTTTALTMTAGIAAAEVSITGDFRLGFNDTAAAATPATGTAAVAPVIAVDPITGVRTVTSTGTAAGTGTNAPVAAVAHDNKLGIYNDAGIAIAMSSTLDNGMAAGITVDLDGSDFGSQAQDKYKFSLSNDSSSLTFGSQEYSSRDNWTSAGDMATDNWANQNADDKNILKATTSVGGLKISASTSVAAGSTTASADPISLTIGGALGGASYVIVNEGSKMGIAATTAVGGSTVTTAYSTSEASVAGVESATLMNTSTGVKITYPMGAISATASYVMESVAATADTTGGDSWNISAVWTSGDTSVTFKTDEDSKNEVEGSTKLGGATVKAGLADYLEDMYLSVSNPLGGGASIMASYAIDGDDGVAGGSSSAKDEVGGPDLQEGLTIELKFAF
jgi:hypothetical protein